MKTTFWAILFFAVFSLLTPARGFADDVLNVSSPATVSQGDTFEVDVDITGASDLYGYQLDLAFDPTILQADSVSEGSFLSDSGANPTFFLPGTIDNTGGTVSLNADSLLTAVSGVNGDGILLVFDFTALNPGTSALTIENEILVDSQGNISNDTTNAGSVTVLAEGQGGGPSVPEPSSLALLLVGVMSLVALSATKRAWISRDICG